MDTNKKGRGAGFFIRVSRKGSPATQGACEARGRVGQSFGMNRIKWVAAVAAVGLGVVCSLLARGAGPGKEAAAEPAPLPKSAVARDAMTVANREIDRANEERNTKVMAALKNYRAALEGAKTAAMKNMDLEEAARVQEEVKRVDQDLKERGGRGAANANPKLVITKARFGVRDKMWDITEVTQAKVKDDVFANPYEGVNDPAFGQVKTMVIEGTYGGLPFTLVYEDKGKHRFGNIVAK
jgi:hypothetical protein